MSWLEEYAAQKALETGLVLGALGFGRFVANPGFRRAAVPFVAAGLVVTYGLAAHREAFPLSKAQGPGVTICNQYTTASSSFTF